MVTRNGKRTRKVVAPGTMPPLEEVLRNRRILVTGGTGFLGKVLLSILLRHHPELERILVLIRGDRRSSLARFRNEILDSPALSPVREHLGANFDRHVEEKVTIVPGDISEPGLISPDAAIDANSIDAVIHCAGLVNFEASLEKAIAINTVGVANVIEFCRTHDASLIHVSTCYVAGIAEGQRFEDDCAVDWCPNGRRNFNLQDEIRDALAAVDRVEAESHDHARLAELRAADEDDQDGEGIGDRAVETRRKQWLEERFKQIGKERALGWGWPNAYSYTKSLGEQLVLGACETITATIVRPSVIESSLCDPSPGWNQGVNTSAPLTYLTGRGFRFIPATGDLPLDVIPVDLVAHAIVPVLAALLLKRHQPVYQLCTSDLNPFPMRQLVELTGLSNRRDHRLNGGPMGKLAPYLDATVVSQNTYELVSSGIPAMLKQTAALARALLGEDSAPARKFEERVDKICKGALMVRSLADVYRPYIQDLAYTFHGKNIRDLYATLSPGDADQHPYHPERIDWNDYWINVHMPGLRRHIFPQLELHTRARPGGSFRYKTLVEMLDRAAERYGARPALDSRNPSGQRTSISYRELRDSAHRAGLMLGTRGINPSDRVLLIAENAPEWVVAYFAILYAGAVAVPLDHLISAEELATISRIAEPRAALVSPACARRLGKAVRTAMPGIVEMELGELERPFVLRAQPAAPVTIARKTLASIVFTSGTTGTPKGVMLTHGNFTAQISSLGRVFALDSDDVLLSLLPLHHTFEFTCGLMLPIASGARIVYPIGIDAASLSRTLADVRPTALVGVPALWEAIHRRILDTVEARGPFFQAAFDQLRDLNRRIDGDYNLNLGTMLFRPAHAALGGRLKLAVSGGAALPQRVAQFFNDIGIKLLEGYGLTESAPVLSVARPDEPLRPGSVGKPLAKVEIKLASANGPDQANDGNRTDQANGTTHTTEINSQTIQIDSINQVGEIIARGPNVMSGYYRNQAATDAVLKDGWLHTGDLGRFDRDGRLYIVGRAKDVIVDSGGNNIYIDELEEAYGHSPHLRELAVVGLKVAQGEQVAALAVPDYAKGDSRRAVEDKLRTHFDQVSARLNTHNRIRILRFTDIELPRTRTRKVKRAEVATILQRMVESHDEARAIVSTEVEPWLAEALAQVANGSPNINPATRLIEDLGLDSLALAELAEHIAVKAGRDLSAEELSNVATVEDLQTIVSDGQKRPKLPSYAHLAAPYTIDLPRPLRRLGEFALRKTLDAAFDSWLKPSVLGRGNIPANRNFIVVANHSSHLDFGLVSHALGASGRELVVLAAKDYFFNTGLRRFAVRNFTRLIPFDRERAQIESLDQALAELAAGRSVLMFPEGTRSPDGAIHEFKSGVGYLASRAGCDVLPIRIRGTFEVLGKGQLLPRRAPVEVRIGSVMSSADLRLVAQDAEGVGAYRKLAECMREAVIGLGTRRPLPARVTTNGAALMPPSEDYPHQEKAHHESHKERRRNHRAGDRAKG
jgi:long-chain acyl-CoA synthetase